jgi:ABC-type lipoprotein release transport system permease subunit
VTTAARVEEILRASVSLGEGHAALDSDPSSWPGMDAATFIAVPLLLAAALGASWLPARRAARVDPARVLQAE